MSKKEFYAEQKAEELLMALGRELGKSRAAFAEALMDDEVPDPPMFSEQKPPTFTRQEPLMTAQQTPDTAAQQGMDTAAQQGMDMAAQQGMDTAAQQGMGEVAPTPKRKRFHMRRAVLLAATLVLILGVFVVSSEGVKLKKNTLHSEDTPAESTRIIDESNAVYDVEDFYVDAIPEGYELVSDEQPAEFMRIIQLVKSEESKISIHIIKTEKYGSNVDNERMDRETVLVNDKQAYLFESKERRVLVWQMGDCTIDISSAASGDVLLEIGKHVFIY